MHPGQMEWRCPMALASRAFILRNWELKFYSHATIEPRKGAEVAGVLWEITDEHLRALDQLEGYPYYYNRVVSSVIHGARTFHVLVYRMQPGHPDSEPTRGYYNLIHEGYRAHGVPTDQLENSLNFSTTVYE